MAVAEKKNSIDIFMLLPAAAVLVDLFTPYLIWKNLLPAPIRWISHAALAAILFLTLIRMLGLNRFPLAFWVSIFIAALWSYVAIAYGQGLVPTIWGVWLLFQFPFVALFMYLQREPPSRLPDYLRTFCLIALGIEAAAQLLQYASGTAPGDDLSGLFGRSGSQSAVIFELFVCCMFFGHWIASRRWVGMAIALALSMLSSVLGEMKIFIPAIAVIALMATILYIRRNHAPGKTVLALVLTVLVMFGFVALYNVTVPSARATPLQTYVTNPTKLLEYLNFSENVVDQGRVYTNMGRFYRVRVGWESLQGDPLKLLFGYGIGTRSESRTLGTAGVALLAGSQGLSVGSSLLVLMQEMGTIGMLLLAGFLSWIILALIHDIRTLPPSQTMGLRYGLLLFTILWPAWLFYSTTWTMRVSMLVYWLALGYVLAQSRMARIEMKDQASRLAAAEA